MKRALFLAILLFAAVGPLVQTIKADKPEQKEFPSERVIKEASIFVEDLNLKGEAAEKFTMLYLEYRRKIHRAMEKNKAPFQGSYSKLTDEQNDKNIRVRFASSKEILDLREQYYPKFLKVMTATQYEQLMRLEKKYFEKSRSERSRRTSVSSSTSKSRTKSSKSSSTSSSSTKSGEKVTINVDQNGQKTKTVVTQDGWTNIYIYDKNGKEIRHIQTRNRSSKPVSSFITDHETDFDFIQLLNDAENYLSLEI